MTTISLSYPSRKPSLIPWLLLGLVIVLAVAAGEHAYQRRVAESANGAVKVDSVINCINKGGTVYQMFNPSTQRKADICLIAGNLDMGTFGVNITAKDGSPVTTILKEKLHCLSQVIKWLENTGYIVLH